MNGLFTQKIRTRGTTALAGLISLLVGMVLSSAALAVDNVQIGYAGADAGDWGGKGGAAVGPADGTCANMGAVGKVNLLSSFGFAIPGGATITAVNALVKGGSSGGQDVGLQLASNATIEPPTTIGNQRNLPTENVGQGNCSVTVPTEVGGDLASWGTNAATLTPAVANSPNFGLVFSKLETSEVKVDSVCLEIEYLTSEGPATLEGCFDEPVPNTITVVKDVVGTVPGDDWDFTGDLDPFTLPAQGGFETFEVEAGIYTIEETTKEGYEVSVECTIGGTVVASGTDSVEVEVDDDEATCIFTNTFIVPPPPATRATFAVTKDFTDNNTAAVTVTLDCSSGLPLVQHQQLTEAGGQWPLVTFILESFGDNTNCNVSEAAVTGYTTTYWNDPEQVANCDYADVVDGEEYVCEITNTPIPQNVSVCKDWVIEGDGGDLIDSTYEITLACNNEIVGSKEYNGTWKRRFYNESGTSDTCDYTADVVPKWNGGTTCTAHEEIDDSSVESSYDCGFNVALAETGEGCTITNTVFYEGIPTLSQYGLAILALLMLGVGFVGFRRFV